MSDRVNAANNLGEALIGDLRTNIKASPKIGNDPDDIPPLPNMRKKITPATFQKKIKRMNEEKLSSKDADFHDFLAFLGRTVKPFK